MGIKNAEFNADFESLKKLLKIHGKKVINENVHGKLSLLTFITMCKNFGLQLF